MCWCGELLVVIDEVNSRSKVSKQRNVGLGGSTLRNPPRAELGPLGGRYEFAEQLGNPRLSSVFTDSQNGT